MTARLLIGDVHDRLGELPDGSVDLVLSSPPFLALRSYLPADHPDKGREIGSEPTPGAFIDTLLDVVEECRRVLAPHGSLCFELGDTYSGSGGAGGDYNEGGLRDGQQAFSGSAAKRRKAGVGDDYRPSRAGRLAAYTDDRGPGWPEAKSLCLIPESFRWALAYGRNPFTGRTTPTWRVRNVVRWCRPNPPVGALGDKFRPATSEMVVACTSRTRWFDLDAVRTDAVTDDSRRDEGPQKYEPGGQPARQTLRTANPAGAPPLDWWKISTEPYAGSHYATWPAELCVRPIAAMCPLRVCTVCGEPSRRIVDVEYERSGGGTTGKRRNLAEPDGRTNGTGMAGKPTMRATTTTIGWTDCGHDSWRRGVVLDPFAGSGTTLAVATGHGRDAIGIDLDARNADLARQRVGMFLEVEGDEGRRIEDVAGAGL